MRYLLDSDAVTVFYDDRREPYHTALHGHISKLDNSDLLQTSVLVLCELEYSCANAPDRLRSSIRRTLEAIPEDFDGVVDLQAEVAPIFGELKARLGRERRLSRKEMRKHNIDLLMASAAIASEAVLIGMDRIFEEIGRFHGGFRHENWLVE